MGVMMKHFSVIQNWDSAEWHQHFILKTGIWEGQYLTWDTENFLSFDQVQQSMSQDQHAKENLKKSQDLCLGGLKNTCAACTFACHLDSPGYKKCENPKIAMQTVLRNKNPFSTPSPTNLLSGSINGTREHTCQGIKCSVLPLKLNLCSK